MSEHFFQDKSVDKAIEKASRELGVEKESLNVEVIDEKDKSVLGMKWGKTVSIKVLLKDKESEFAPINENPVDISKQSLEKILEFMNIQGSINVTESNNEIVLDVQMEKDVESLFIGRRGKNLDAFQYIINKIVDNKIEGKSKRVVIDSEDYKARRQGRLESMAAKAIKAVKNSGEGYTFPPMKADERRIIHITVKKEGLFTESKGNGIEKKVVIYPSNSV